MKNNLKTYENRVLKLKHRLKYLGNNIRILKLKHRLKYLCNNINEFKELNKEILRLNKIIKSKIDKKKYFKYSK